MKHSFQPIIEILYKNPKKIFLMDALGAVLSACLLLFLLAPFSYFFGMPLAAVSFLSVMPVVYALYSFCCYRFLSGNWRPFLAGIIFGNLLYFFVSLAFVIYHFNLLTVAGVAYFMLELIVLAAVVMLEVKCYHVVGANL